MHGHLSSEQIDEILHGAATPRADAHLAACTACAEEVASLRSVLGDWRDATTTWAAHEHAAAATARPAAQAARSRWFLPVLMPLAAMGVIAAVIVVPKYEAAHPPAPTTTAARTPQPAVTATSDASLLDAVNADLSASLPDAMEPLARTSATDTSSAKRSARN